MRTFWIGVFFVVLAMMSAFVVATVAQPHWSDSGSIITASGAYGLGGRQDIYVQTASHGTFYCSAEYSIFTDRMNVTIVKHAWSYTVNGVYCSS